MKNTIIRSLTVLVVALPAGMATAQSEYPQVTRAQITVPMPRPCTQLEFSAGIPADQCGTLTVAEVVKAMNESKAD